MENLLYIDVIMAARIEYATSLPMLFENEFYTILIVPIVFQFITMVQITYIIWISIIHWMTN